MRIPITVVSLLLGGTALPALAIETPLKINLVNTGGAEAGTDAYYGFKTAAKFWETHLTTSQPTVVTIDVGFQSLDPGVLGSTGSNFTSKSVQGIESRIAARSTSAFDAKAVANLPGLTTGQLGVGALDVYTPGYTGTGINGPYGIDNTTKVYDTDGSYNNSVIGLTTANAKALGYAVAPGTVDASITFSSDFGFDFHPQDGIDTGKYDFLSVAIHEIGHSLGFVSGVDDYDYIGTGGPLANVDLGGFLGKDYAANDDWFGETLDLFRYSGTGALDWTTNTASYFSVDGGTSAYQNGYFATGAFNGDGDQASHWKAPIVAPFCSGLLGIMNPYACSKTNGIVTALDLAAFDAIGYNTTVDVTSNPNFKISTANVSSFVPEPATWAMMIAGFGFVGAMQRRRRTGYASA